MKNHCTELLLHIFSKSSCMSGYFDESLMAEYS